MDKREGGTPRTHLHYTRDISMPEANMLVDYVNRLECELATERERAEKERADDAIYAELDKALAKFPTWPTDPLHAVGVVGEEYGELVKAVLQLTYEPHKCSMDDVREEAIQTAAMAIRFVRSLDAYQFKAGEQHKQAIAALRQEERK